LGSAGAPPNDRNKLGDRSVDRGSDRTRGAVDVLERRREALKQGHRAVGGKHRVAASNRLDLAHGLLHALDRGLRPPTEGVAPEPRRECPLVAAGLHRPKHSFDRAQSLLASDPIDLSHLVGVTLFGQEKLAVMGELLLAGVARDRGENMRHPPIPP
jgi:hypothetical protein